MNTLRLWIGLAISAGIASAVAVAIFWPFGEEPDSPQPAPTTVAPAGCPVDAAICEFAKRVEYEFRDGDPKTLLSPKSTYYPDTGVILAGTHAFLQAPLLPRVISIGCPISPDGAVCRDGFALVLTATPEGQPPGQLSHVLLGFRRDGTDLPIITTNRLVAGIDVALHGGDTGGCEMTGLSDDDPCQGSRFFPYTTGPEVFREPTPMPPTPSAVDPLAGAEVVELTPGPSASIGYDTVVYYSNGCYGCGRPQIPGLFRAYRDSTGQLRTDDLFGPLFAKVGGYPQSVAADWELGHLLVLVCATGYCGGEADPSPDASVRMFRSRDGGVTFNEEPIPGFPVLSYLGGFTGDEAIVRASERKGIEERQRYFLYPSNKELAPPAGIGKAEPFPDHDGAIGWLSFDPATGFYDSAGKLLVPASPGRSLVSVTPLPVGWLAKWSGNGAGDESFGLYDGTGRLIRVLHTDLLSDFRGSQLPDGLLVANVTLSPTYAAERSEPCKFNASSYASLVNWNTGTVHPIIELGDCVGANQHRYVNAIVARSVVRVRTGRDCLNVRTEPSTEAPSIGCFADGVLLGLRFDGPPPVVTGWVAVVTPALEPGWVSEQFVER